MKLYFMNQCSPFFAMHLCFPSWCYVVVFNGFVFVLSFMIEGKIECVIFPSWCNVVFGDALNLMLKVKLRHVSLCYKEM